MSLHGSVLGVEAVLASGEVVDCLSSMKKDNTGYDLNLTCPLEPSNFYMLIETSGSKAEHDEEKLNLFLEEMLEKGSVSDGTVASAPGKQKEPWQLRERIAEALLKDGYCYKYDISLPLSVFYDSVTVMRERMEGKGATRVVGYGHVGDGNMHLNITTPEYSQEVMDGIEPF